MSVEKGGLLQRGLKKLDRPFLSDGTANAVGLAAGIFLFCVVLSQEGVSSPATPVHNIVIAGLIGIAGGIFVNAGARAIE